MKILICSDGGKQAAHAIRVIAPIAAACAAEVTVLGIIENRGDESPLTEALLRSMQILRDHGVDAELTTKSGLPIVEIQKRTEETDYDLVVIGATRKRRRGAFWMPMKVYKIIKLIKPPVLLMMGDRPAIKRVLICSGGKNYIHRAVEMAGKLAATGGVSVNIVHVMVEPPALYSDMIKNEMNVEDLLVADTALGKNLRAEKEVLGKMNIEAGIRIRHGMVVSEIQDEMRAGDYDLVVVGTPLSSGPLHSYVLGNITQEIVNRVGRPVLVVRGGLAVPTWKQIFNELANMFRPSA